jgi:branched-chain amino acid transport system permease protein
MNVNIIIQQVINFLQLGSIYALCALSFTMVYGVARLVNFAHGSIFGVSMYVLFFASTFLFERRKSPWFVNVIC